MLLESLLLVNEEALSLFASGNPDLAVERFRHALSMLRSVVSHFQEPLLSGATFGQAVPQALPTASFDSWYSEALGFYPKAFQVHGIPDSSLQVPADKIRDQEIVILSRLIAPALLYNFALALQLSADSEANRPSLFSKACKVYFLCLQSLGEDQIEGNAQILRLAASTNMVQSIRTSIDQTNRKHATLSSKAVLITLSPSQTKKEKNFRSSILKPGSTAGKTLLQLNTLPPTLPRGHVFLNGYKRSPLP